MILYKYLPPERTDILANRLIAFTPPWLFNDPFEAEPLFPSDSPAAIRLFEEAQPTRASLSEQEESALQRRIDKLQWEHGLARLTWEQATRSVGVLSLSETCDCPLMWAHYTKQHTGFVVGFDTTHPAWVELCRLHGRPGEPRKVIYSAERPNPAAMGEVTPDQIWYTKSIDWAYEREWRVTRWIARATKTVKNESGDDIPLYEFPPGALQTVILGQRANESLEFIVQDLICRPPYRNTAVQRAQLDSKAFKLNVMRS
jgi:hypothetical protein